MEEVWACEVGETEVFPIGRHYISSELLGGMVLGIGGVEGSLVGNFVGR